MTIKEPYASLCNAVDVSQTITYKSLREKVEKVALETEGNILYPNPEMVYQLH